MKYFGYLLFVLAGISTCWAEPKKKSEPQAVDIDVLVIEGKIQKPEAFYILQRAKPSFKALKPKKSFVPLILKTVDKKPF